MKSIMQSDDRSCYLCELLKNDYMHQYVEEHHIFGNHANRKLSTKYGLTVYLCIWHHREGKDAVHNNAEMMNLLKRKGQEAFEKHYPDLDFRQIFGKNYL
jgi:hypothetical protein